MQDGLQTTRCKKPAAKLSPATANLKPQLRIHPNAAAVRLRDYAQRERKEERRNAHLKTARHFSPSRLNANRLSLATIERCCRRPNKGKSAFIF